MACVHIGAGELEDAAKALDAAWGRRNRLFDFWILAMRWCVDSSTVRLDKAGTRLAESCRTAGIELAAAERAIYRLCVDGHGEDIVLEDFGGEPDDACARLFFAAWRARQQGNADRASRLLVECINTGATGWSQWRMALSMAETARERGELGVELSFEDSQVVVAEVPPGSAAHYQGLQKGDVVTRVCGRPMDRAAWCDLVESLRVGRFVHFELRRGEAVVSLVVRAGLVVPR